MSDINNLSNQFLRQQILQQQAKKVEEKLDEQNQEQLQESKEAEDTNTDKQEFQERGNELLDAQNYIAMQRRVALRRTAKKVNTAEPKETPKVTNRVTNNTPNTRRRQTTTLSSMSSVPAVVNPEPAPEFKSDQIQDQTIKPEEQEPTINEQQETVINKETQEPEYITNDPEVKNLREQIENIEARITATETEIASIENDIGLLFNSGYSDLEAALQNYTSAYSEWAAENGNAENAVKQAKEAYNNYLENLKHAFLLSDKDFETLMQDVSDSSGNNDTIPDDIKTALYKEIQRGNDGSIALFYVVNETDSYGNTGFPAYRTICSGAIADFIGITAAMQSVPNIDWTDYFLQHTDFSELGPGTGTPIGNPFDKESLFKFAKAALANEISKAEAALTKKPKIEDYMTQEQIDTHNSMGMQIASLKEQGFRLDAELKQLNDNLKEQNSSLETRIRYLNHMNL